MAFPQCERVGAGGKVAESGTGRRYFFLRGRSGRGCPRKEKGSASIRPGADPLAGEVQLRYATNLTDEEYVCQRAWETATLSSCPLHRAGGCEFSRHTAYTRKAPAGTLIARYYCRTARVTFSLLPDCFASRLSGSLQEVEAAVAAAEAAPTLTDAAQQVRPELMDVRHALKWLRRRTRPVKVALTALVTLLETLEGVDATVTAVRVALGTEQVLVTIRELLSEQLSSLRHPVGLRPRGPKRNDAAEVSQHKAGPDPPARPG